MLLSKNIIDIIQFMDHTYNNGGLGNTPIKTYTFTTFTTFTTLFVLHPASIFLVFKLHAPFRISALEISLISFAIFSLGIVAVTRF